VTDYIGIDKAVKDINILAYNMASLELAKVKYSTVTEQTKLARLKRRMYD
jgi:hypothetical protein